MRDTEPLLLLRAMDEDVDGLPLVGPFNWTLGLRTGERPRDIDVDERGWVRPIRPRPRGMSVAPRDAASLPIRHRPASLSGQATYPIWAILEADVEPPLRYVATSATHGVIEPGEPMPLSAYEQRLADTRSLWRKVYEEFGEPV